MDQDSLESNPARKQQRDAASCTSADWRTVLHSFKGETAAIRGDRDISVSMASAAGDSDTALSSTRRQREKCTSRWTSEVWDSCRN